MKESDHFIEDEFAKKSWYEKNIRSPTFDNTQLLVSHFFHINPEKERIIRPSVSQRIFIILILLFFVGMSIFFLVALIMGNFVPVSIYFLLFIGVSIAILKWHWFVDKKYNYVIKLNKEGLHIGHEIMLWKEISGTYILHRYGKRGRNTFLVIFKKDGSVSRHSLFNFGITDAKLSTLIELYKQ